MMNALNIDIDILQARIERMAAALDSLGTGPHDPLWSRWERQRGMLVNQQAVLFAVKEGF